MAWHFQVHVAHAKHGHDRAAAFGFSDRIDTRVEPRRDEGFDAGDRQFLVSRIGQVDDLGDEVVAFDLVEVFVGEVDGNVIVREIGVGLRVPNSFRCDNRLPPKPERRSDSSAANRHA